MSADPGRYWQDSDDPNWSDEVEARFAIELSLWSIENALRPRDELDVDVFAETFRGTVLAFYDSLDGVRRQIDGLPWYRRWAVKGAIRLAGLWARGARLLSR